jgi:hypothetical protein
VASFPYGRYRRRIRVVARAPDTVEAGIEDDFHHFRVTLHHDGVNVRDVSSEAHRIPWTTCTDAGAQLQLLAGMPLEASCLAAGRWTSPSQQCTHMFDLAGLAAAHAYRRATDDRAASSRQYDAVVPYESRRGARREVTLARDRTVLLHWIIERDQVVDPPPYSEVPFTGGFFRWADTALPPDDAEAAIVLRRACTIGMGRGMDQDVWSSAAEISAGPTGVCYSQQPQRRDVAFRVRGNIADFDSDPEALLADGP